MEQREQQQELHSARDILRELEEHGPILRRMGVRKIGLFGSYQAGNFTSESDIDFVIVLDNPSFDDYMSVKLFLEDLFGCRIDLVREQAIKPRIRPGILEDVQYASGL